MDRKVPTEWNSLTYFRPAVVLDRLRRLASSGLLSGLPYQVQALRRNDLREYREGRQAALFCYGVGRAIGVEVGFALFEKEDYDIVARFRLGDTEHFVPVQLKELVPAKLNDKADLQGELDKLSRKYLTSADLVVAIHVNRDITDLHPAELRLPRGLAQIWLYGACDRNQERWLIIGDLLKDANRVYEFHYPLPQFRYWEHTCDGPYAQRRPI